MTSDRSDHPPLFDDFDLAREVLIARSAILGDLDVAAHLLQLWGKYHPYADRVFVSRIRAAVLSLADNETPGPGRTAAVHSLHQVYWEMFTGVALLAQGIDLVPRNSWGGGAGDGGPDLQATRHGKTIWIECVAPVAGVGADAVPELHDSGASDVPIELIGLRVLSALHFKRKRFAQYIRDGVVRPDDAIVIAINPRSIPFATLDDDPPWIVRRLYGLGFHAVNFDLSAQYWSDPYLTVKPSIKKRNQQHIDANLFGGGSAKEVSGVLYSAVDAWNHPADPSRGVIFVHNATANNPLPEYWLPKSTSYTVKAEGRVGTVHRIDP